MSFKNLKNSASKLNKQEMGSVKGGGTCGYMGQEVNGSRTVMCGLSKAEALFMFADGGGGSRWCCDSCYKTSYCG